MIYPWLSANQFQVSIPVEQNPLWPNIATQAYDTLERYKIEHDHTQIKYNESIWRIEPDEDLHDIPDSITEKSAAEKLCMFLERRDVHVIYHGPDECCEKIRSFPSDVCQPDSTGL